MWPDRVKTAIAVAAIAGAALAAYANTFGVPFVFDDPPSILDNPGIRHLWPIWDAFRPQAPASTVDGRPLANFTLAVNYAISGTDVWSYHALNLLIHICAGLTLFGVVRRTLLLAWRKGQSAKGISSSQSSTGPVTAPFRPLALTSYPLALGLGNATFLAFAIALLWTLHPLQTEAVTYVVQRVESLMGLFYLLTLYCFIRGAEGTTGPQTTDHETKGPKDEKTKGPFRTGVPWSLGPLVPWSFGPQVWHFLSVACCFLGMATKEVMVTAPAMVFLYDRTFLAGTFREAWRRRWKLHLALASTWLLLLALVAGTGWDRGGAAGFAPSSGVIPGFWAAAASGST